MNKRLLTVAAFALAGCVTIVAQDKKKEFKMPTGYAGITHEMSEFYEPVPPVVTPGTDLKGGGFTAPSDAIVLFDGKDLSAWESVKGGAAEWDVHDGVFTVNKKKGDIQTKQKSTISRCTSSGRSRRISLERASREVTAVFSCKGCMRFKC